VLVVTDIPCHNVDPHAASQTFQVNLDSNRVNRNRRVDSMTAKSKPINHVANQALE
jgi:hypothetical protein